MSCQPMISQNIICIICLLFYYLDLLKLAYGFKKNRQTNKEK